MEKVEGLRVVLGKRRAADGGGGEAVTTLGSIASVIAQGRSFRILVAEKEVSALLLWSLPPPPEKARTASEIKRA